MPTRLLHRLWDAALLLSVVGAACSAAYAVRAAWHWPLVGDAALMRYVVLLLHSGQAPYAQIVDVNLPGTYALEAGAMRVFGPGGIGLRLYDGALCLAAIGLCAVLSEPGWRSRVCGVTAGLLFCIVHLRDGVVQAGQRDLAMAVVVLAAIALYLRTPGLGDFARLAAFELAVGVTLTIKPTLLPLAALPWLAASWGQASRFRWRDSIRGSAFLLLPAAMVLAWLQRWKAVPAFFEMLHWIAPAHRLLAHKGYVFLLTHAGAPLWALFCLALVLGTTLKVYREFETRVLLFGLGCGVFSFVAQGKGFPYQRYPFLLLALVFASRMLRRASVGPGAIQAASAVVLLCLGLRVAPEYARTVAAYDTIAPFQNALASDLSARGATAGEVQCLDTVGGCISTLYRLHLVQSTGFLYDCYAYEGTEQERTRYRQGFLSALDSTEPRYIVLSSEFCLHANGKLDRPTEWPELKHFLDAGYRPVSRWDSGSSVRWWNQREVPPSYVLYSRRTWLP